MRSRYGDLKGPSASAESAKSLRAPAGAVPISGGERIDGPARTLMESRFQHDFSAVRVHADAGAADRAASYSAAAFTIGDHITFGAGRYEPYTLSGLRLLAHELTHVVQQRGYPNPHGDEILAGENARFSSPVSEAEHEARENSARVEAGGSAFVQQQQPVGVAKQPLSDEEKIRRSLGLGPDPKADKPKVVWLGERPSWLGTDKDKTPVTWLGTPPSAATRKSVEAARAAPPPKTPMSQLLPPPRTPFEAQAFKRNLRRIRDPKTGEIIGFFAVEGGVYHVYDIDGKSTIVGEKGLESPLIDPIDFIPFELLGSLAAKATSAVARTAVKATTRVAAKEIATEGVEVGTKVLMEDAAKAGGKGAATEASQVAEEEFRAFQQMLADEGSTGPLRAEGELTQLGPHGAASTNRAATGVSGRTVQSAHLLPQSVGKGVAGYNPNHALTKLLDRHVHTAMDSYWKTAFKEMRAAGQKTATAQTVHDVVAESIRRAPRLSPGQKQSLIARLGDEMFVEFGLKPGDILDLPYPNIKPK